MRLSSLPLLALVSFLPACHSSPEKHWVLQPAGEYHFVVTATETSSMRNHPDTLLTGFRLAPLLPAGTEEADSLLRLRIVFDQLRRADRNPVMMVSGQSPNAMEKIYQEMNAFNDSCRIMIVGDSVELVCRRGGQVEYVDGAEAIIKKIAAATGEDSRTVYSSLHDLFGTQVLRDLFTRLFFYLPPARTVKAGDSWVNNYILRAKAPVQYSNIVTVQAVQGDTVVLQVKTAVSAWTNELSGRIFAKGMQWGTVTASLSTGLPYQCKLEDTMVVTTDAYNVRTGHSFFVERSEVGGRR